MTEVAERSTTRTSIMSLCLYSFNVIRVSFSGLYERLSASSQRRWRSFLCAWVSKVATALRFRALTKASFFLCN